jgi:sugar-phosphatase
VIATATELRCEAMLFDLDGVLVSSGHAVERSWRAWSARHGLDGAEVLRRCHGQRSQETIAAVAPHLDAVDEARRLEAEQADDTEELTACAGAAAMLAGLRGATWAVVTSGSRALALARLRGTGLPVPEVLVAGDDVRLGKPAPECYLAAARRLGVEPAVCVAVEDARPGVLAARAAGIRVIGIAGHPLGPATDVDLVIGSLAELRPAVEPGTRPSIRLARRVA